VWRGDKGKFHPLVEHFDGTSWSIVRAPYPGPQGARPVAVGTAGDDVWWVGSTGDRFTHAASARRC